MRSLYGLWTPDRAEDRTPVARCRVCGAGFFDMGVFERHVGPCARENVDAMRAQRDAETLPVMQWVPDPEVKEYLEGTVGPRMRREGRLEMKKSERAGFS